MSSPFHASVFRPSATQKAQKERAFKTKRRLLLSRRRFERGCWPRSITKHHEASRSITKHHEASRSITKHREASRSIAKHREASRSIAKHHEASRSTEQDGSSTVMTKNWGSGTRPREFEAEFQAHELLKLVEVFKLITVPGRCFCACCFSSLLKVVYYCSTLKTVHLQSERYSKCPHSLSRVLNQCLFLRGAGALNCCLNFKTNEGRAVSSKLSCSVTVHFCLQAVSRLCLRLLWSVSPCSRFESDGAFILHRANPVPDSDTQALFTKQTSRQSWHVPWANPRSHSHSEL